MALSPQRKCSDPGCRLLTRESRCENHAKTGPRSKPGDPFYSSTGWRKLRARMLRSSPLCADCEHDGRVTPANEVHHVMKREIHPELAYDEDNLESLCKSCHSKRTARGE